MTPTPKELREAADRFDWVQPLTSDWNPCFALMNDGRFCGRAERWVGHEIGHDHAHVPLREIIASGLTDEDVSEIRKVRDGMLRKPDCLTGWTTMSLWLKGWAAALDAVLARHAK